MIVPSDNVLFDGACSNGMGFGCGWGLAPGFGVGFAPGFGFGFGLGMGTMAVECDEDCVEADSGSAGCECSGGLPLK